MDNHFHVSSSPHARDHRTTGSIMLDVALALLPATAVGVVRFGIRALLVVLTTVVSALLAEYIWEKAMKKPLTTGDGSALVTGLILALNMPPSIPLWMPAVGAVFAIIVVKQLYGGIGQNFANPAVAARCFLMLCFTKYMTTLVPDGISAATPLTSLRAGETVSLWDLFLGRTYGTIGETSVLAILLGALYLLIRKVISLRIPLTYLVVTGLFLLAFGKDPGNFYYVLCELCAGGLMFGAFFMATDYVTSPITPIGKIVFGIGLGLLTGIFRVFSPSTEGVSYAIFIMNLLVPLIERVTRPTAFGKEGKKRG